MVKNNHTSTTKKKKKKLPSSRQSFTLTKRKGHASPTTQLPICKLKDTKNNVRTSLEPTDEMTKQFCYEKSS